MRIAEGVAIGHTGDASNLEGVAIGHTRYASNLEGVAIGHTRYASNLAMRLPVGILSRLLAQNLRGAL